MNKKFIKTQIGEIAIYERQVPDTIPIIFLHGVYFDHNLWKFHSNQIIDRTTILVDMPLHGESRTNISANWNLNDCANMLLEILDTLNIEKIYAVGHSWGSMTILRALNKQPQRFVAVGLCNMPYESGSKQKIKFFFQHLLLSFRKFYMKQVSKAIFGKQSLIKQPHITNELFISMAKLSNKDIKQIDNAVILNAENASKYLDKLKSNDLILLGDEEYVKPHPKLNTQLVKGGHISPLEAKEELMIFINKILQ